MNLKNSKKYVEIAILAFMLTGTMILVPLSTAFMSGTSSKGTNYAIFEGTTGNDYYSSMQYSYDINQWAIESSYYNSSVGTLGSGRPIYVTPGDVWFNASDGLRIGMTEYGEFATPCYAGIAYGNNAEMWNLTESWATSNPNVPSGLWIQGWVLAVNYTSQTVPMSLEAYALYSNFSRTPELGRGAWAWLQQYAPNDLPDSQLTAASLTPTGVQVLYDSARLAVARTTVIIGEPFVGFPFAQVTFTLVFNKVAKFAIVYKDVKMLLPTKYIDKISDFCFSERYELDLASWLNPDNEAFIHYYGNYSSSDYYHPLTNSSWYDVLQAYDVNHEFIFFAGYWPNATEYSVYSPLVPRIPEQGLTRLLPIGTHNASLPVAEAPPPNTPWVVVQWRYDSSETKYTNLLQWLCKQGSSREIRFVEVMGMTNYNHDLQPAVDPQDPMYNLLPTTDYLSPTYINAHPWTGSNEYKWGGELDTEVAAIMDFVFNPPDLTDMPNLMWIGLGQSSATTDSAAASFITGGAQGFEYWEQPMVMFDRNDTMFPWSAPVVAMAGTIPYGLTNFGTAKSPQYYQVFDDCDKGTGADTTKYERTTLQEFAFGVYDNVTMSPPQPIAGGFSELGYYNFTNKDYTAFYHHLYPFYYWYPSKSPISERWVYFYSPVDARWEWGWYPYNVPTKPYLHYPSGIATLGGEKADGLTRYFNDFGIAISREGTTTDELIRNGHATGIAPTSNGSLPTLDYFPISSWMTNVTTFNYGPNYAVISLARDINGTWGLSIYGWNGRDTYWAAAWASQYIYGSDQNGWIPEGTVALILRITYAGPNAEPTMFTVVQCLGTITQMGTNAFATKYGTGWIGTVQSTISSSYGYIPPYPIVNLWWYGKLPTDSTATVQFDP